MQAIAGVLFDKDGTLFDFHATWAGWAARLLDELAASDEARAVRIGASIGFDYHALRFEPDSPVIAGTPQEVSELLLPSLPEWGAAELVARMNRLAAEARMVEAVPLRPLLVELRAAGLRVGVATNDAQAPARAHLEGAGVAEMFDFIAGYDSGFGAKPGPGMLLAFAEAAALVPAQVLMVGDSRHDLEAGRAAGMRTAGVLTGPARHADLADLADVVLPDIGHVPALLRDGAQPV